MNLPIPTNSEIFMVGLVQMNSESKAFYDAGKLYFFEFLNDWK